MPQLRPATHEGQLIHSGVSRLPLPRNLEKQQRWRQRSTVDGSSPNVDGQPPARASALADDARAICLGLAAETRGALRERVRRQADHQIPEIELLAADPPLS